MSKENKSGIWPVEYKILVKPDPVEKISAGGIILTEQTQDKERYSKEEGVIVAIGSIAFTDPNWQVRPEVGHRIRHDRYDGALVKGKDGEEYRLINDKAIVAILEVEV